MIEDNLGLVTNIIASPPMKRSALRSAIEMLVPTTDWMSVVVGREAREHLAAARDLEELRALHDDVRIDRVADVGGDALAQPRYGVKARRGRDASTLATRRARGSRGPRAGCSFGAGGGGPKPRSIICLNAYGIASVARAAHSSAMPAQHELALVP